MDTMKPDALGFNAKRLQHIDTAMARFIDQGRVAGIATRVLRKGQLVHQGEYGMASTAPDKLMQQDTLFRIWSITKAITVVAALTLYEQGYFGLDQDITEFLPELRETPVYVSGEGESMVVEPRKSPMTVRQAMSHTVGLAGGSDNHPADQMMISRLGRYPLETLIKRIAEVPLRYQPGTRWHYSQSLELIARMVEVISGQRFCDYVREAVCVPLGMIDTGFTVQDGQFDRFSTLYTWDGNRGFTQAQAPSESPEYRFRRPESDPEWTGTGGTGLVSTPLDIARFAQMLLNGGTLDGERLLAPRTVGLMSANHLAAALLPYNFPQSPPMRGYGHGLGVHVLMDHGLAGLPCSNGEYWKDGGAGTLFWVDPTLDLVGVAMYQLLDFWRVPVFNTFRTTVYQAIEI